MNDRQTQLTEAFQAFNSLSEQLARSYGELEQRVEQLSAELAAARSQRLQELAEKARLANRLSRLLEALPAGVIVLDADGLIHIANPAAVELLGEPLVGESWATVRDRALQPDTAAGVELRLRDGRRVTVSGRDLGSEPGRILVLQDVTETRELQELAHRQQRLSAMGEMAAELAHQVRTPLASALLYTGHLERSDLDVTARAHIAGKITARLRHLEQLVQDMLVFVRGGSPARARVDLGELAAALRQTVAPLAQSLDATLEVAFEPGLCVTGHQDALLGALVNLVTNALQAAGSGGHVRAIAAPAGPNIDLFITDDGPGVPAELRERVFDPFFTTRPQGTGLGLAVVREVMRSHGGEVRLVPGEGGATFIVHLPRAERERPLPPRFTTAPPLTGQVPRREPERAASEVTS